MPPPDAADRPRVLFDTNVVEGKHLAPLLRGETIRDYARVAAAGYRPCVAMHTVLEITQHAKLGSKPRPWMSEDVGYPGGLEEGRRIVAQIVDPETIDENLTWFFGLAEEWRGRTAKHQYPLDLVADESGRERLRAEAEHKVEFARWKFALSAFCSRVFHVLEKQADILTDHDVFGRGRADCDRSFRLQLEIARDALIPSEDFVLVQLALMTGAAAFVTEDERLLRGGGLSLSLNRKLAFVHPEQLGEALEGDFWWRYTHRPKGSRS